MHERHATSRDAMREMEERGGGSAAVRAERMEYLEGKKSRIPSLV